MCDNRSFISQSLNPFWISDKGFGYTHTHTHTHTHKSRHLFWSKHRPHMHHSLGIFSPKSFGILNKLTSSSEVNLSIIIFLILRYSQWIINSMWCTQINQLLLSCCLTSTEARWPIRDGDRVGRGRESDRLDRGKRPKKTGETMDRRQNNESVKVVSPRHCPATCALCNCSFNCCAGQSH